MPIPVYAEEMNRGIRRIWALIRKELDWVVKDKYAMYIFFLSPIILLYLVGNVSFEGLIDPPVIYFIDQDNTNLSHEYIQSFRSDEWGMEIYDDNIDPQIVSLEKAQRLISTPALQAYIVIPNGFEENLIANRSTNMTVVINGINSIETLKVKTIITAATLKFQSESLVFNGEILQIPQVIPPADYLSFVELTAVDYAPSMISIILFGAVNLVTSQSIVSDKPLKRMLLSPARKTEIIIAKALAYAFLGSILSLIVLIFVYFYYEIPLVSFLQTYIATFCVVVFGICLGILFSCLSTSQIQAAQMFLYVFIIQLLIITNFRIVPLVSFMPIEITRKLFIDVGFRGIPLNETSWLTEIWGYNLIILVLSSIVYSLKKEPV